LQGFPQGWTLPAEDFHLNDEEIDTLRYHAIGNAVSVPVVKWVAGNIRAELLRAGTPDANHWMTHQHALNRVKDFAVKRAALVDISSFGRDDAPKIKWNTGGVMFGGYCLMTPVSAAPNHPVNSMFSEILDVERPASRYFLSANAATGILRRVASQDRQLFGPLDAALRRLAPGKAVVTKSMVVSRSAAQTNYG
jgi:DNA (cytosine-5)-methyltransferase 1